MAPKLKANGKKRRRDDEQEAMPRAWDKQPFELLEQCFKKELALILKHYLTDLYSHKRVFYFRRNYHTEPEPGLREVCENIVDLLYSRADKRLQEAVSDARLWRAIEEKALLKPYFFHVDENKGFLKCSWPACYVSFGDKPEHREFGGVSGRIRDALGQWREQDIRQWVVIAELELGGSQLSRILFGGTDDHMEIKVTGFGKSISVVLPEADSLEHLADIVDERILVPWQEKEGREGEYYGSWVLRVIDKQRKRRAAEIRKRIIPCRLPVLAADATSAVKEYHRQVESIQSLAPGTPGYGLRQLIELKHKCGAIQQIEAKKMLSEVRRCFPYQRIAPYNEELDTQEFEEYLNQDILSMLPAPEDFPLLAHSEDDTETGVEIEFGWIKLCGQSCKVEVVSRVPKDWRRPYALMRGEVRQARDDHSGFLDGSL